MKIRFAQVLFVLIGLALCVSADTLVDDFSTAQGPVDGESWASGGGILGGTRYIHYNGDESNYVESASGNLDFVYGSAGGDYLTITYDGGTGDIEPDYTGLGGVNLGGAGGYFQFSINSASYAELNITAWTSEEYASTIQGVAVPGSGGLVDIYFSSFEQFGALGFADFTDIGALTIEVIPVDREVGIGGSMNIGEIRAVPEPASAALMLGATVVGLFIRRVFCD